MLRSAAQCLGIHCMYSCQQLPPSGELHMAVTLLAVLLQHQVVVDPNGVPVCELHQEADGNRASSGCCSFRAPLMCVLHRVSSRRTLKSRRLRWPPGCSRPLLAQVWPPGIGCSRPLCMDPLLPSSCMSSD